MPVGSLTARPSSSTTESPRGSPITLRAIAGGTRNKEGRAADVPVAWLDVSAGSLEALSQRYERRAEVTYWYEAPRFGYAALLEVTPAGFVKRYPGLWQAES
jgi:hypothetical protein